MKKCDECKDEYPTEEILWVRLFRKNLCAPCESKLVLKQKELENPWTEVQTLLDGAEDIEEAKYPEQDQWVVVEITDDFGTKYQAVQFSGRSWPSFGLRWKPI